MRQIFFTMEFEFELIYHWAKKRPQEDRGLYVMGSQS